MKVCGKPSTMGLPFYWKVNSDQQWCQTAWIPHWLPLLRLCFNSCGDGKKRSVIHVDLCESLFGHLLFGHLVLTCKSVRWREWNKDRIVCVSVQTQNLSWDGRELADEFLRYTPFAPFCSVLLHCVIPGDVNWHVSPGWQKLGMQLDSRR